MSKYRMVDINSKEPIQYCGYYVLKVDKTMPKPDCLFVEDDEECCEKIREQRDKEIIALIIKNKNFCTCDYDCSDKIEDKQSDKIVRLIRGVKDE